MKKYDRTQIRCINTGQLYESLSAAAVAIGCTKGALSNHLSGRYPHLAGKKYERVMKP